MRASYPITPANKENTTKKRVLSSPLSPEDVYNKKTKSVVEMASMTGRANPMEDDSETIFTAPPMYPLTEIELANISDSIKPAIHSNVLAEIRGDLRTIIKEAVSELLDEKLAPLKKDNERLKKENTTMKGQIAVLEQKVDDSEQYSRRNCLRLSNIEEAENEDTDILVLQVARTLKIKMDHRDIDRSHRVGKPGSKPHRDIIVKFATYRARERMFSKRSDLKGSDMDGVYVNEDLTKKRSKILFEARQMIKAETPKLLGAWSSDGRILIKDLKEKVHRVTSLESIQNFIPKSATPAPDPPDAPGPHGPSTSGT